MTQDDTVRHWQKGARDALQLARRAHEDSLFSLALFHCHLSVEKALKATFIAKKQSSPPQIHDLMELASLVQHSWSAEEKIQLDELTDFAVLSRYGDMQWEFTSANKENSDRWIKCATKFLSVLLDS